MQFTGDSSSEAAAKDEPSSSAALNQCRLMEKKDVIPVKSTGFRVLDCIQKTPKRVAVSCFIALQAMGL